MSGVTEAVVRIVEELAEAHVCSLAAAYQCWPAYSTGAADAVRTELPAGHREQVDPLNRAWCETPDTTGASIALALETALTSKRIAASASVDVVITGPDSPGAPVRLTSEVVRQMIDNAQQRVMLVSYAAYHVPSVISALDRAAARGVRVDLILESAEFLEGGGGAAAYTKYRTYQWPIDRREPSDAKLHAKAVVVDGRDALLTSANMTNAAYDKNIELGVLCRGGTTAQRVEKHLDSLISRGVLAEAPRSTRTQ